jgi:serralysin
LLQLQPLFVPTVKFYLRAYLEFSFLTLLVLIVYSDRACQPKVNRKVSSEMVGTIPSGYKLTFSDEFDTLSLDTAADGGETWATKFVKWNVRSLPSNSEKQFYVDADLHGQSGALVNVNPFSINNGVLTIEGKPASKAVTGDIWGYQYTSGHISTELSFAQQYGYFEIRAQLPAGQGIWPCFWMLPVDGSWPLEIDVFEMLGHEPNVIHQSTHGTGGATGSHVLNQDATHWHTYGLEWTEKTITWTIDGVVTRKAANEFHKPMYMIANLAIGGNWPGDPDATTPWPVRYNIDYIRAYTKTTDVPPVSDHASQQRRRMKD